MQWYKLLQQLFATAWAIVTVLQQVLQQFLETVALHHDIQHLY